MPRAVTTVKTAPSTTPNDASALRTTADTPRTPLPSGAHIRYGQGMDDDTLLIRLATVDADQHEAELDRLDELVENRGIGESAGTMDLAGLDRVLVIEVEPGALLIERKTQLEALLAEVGLQGIAAVEIPKSGTDEDELDGDLDVDDIDDDDDPDDDDLDLDDESLDDEDLEDDDDPSEDA